MSYDTDGNLAERIVLGNNMTTTYAYDYQNCLTAMKNQTGSAGVISEYTSEYLANGQKSKETSDVMDKNGKKSKKTAIDLVTYLEKSTDEWGGALEDFYYQLSCYDFDNDGEKEIIVGAGNKQNILELCILRLDYNNPDFGNAKILKSINSGCKAYVNEKGEICVMDSQGEILTYSLNN